MSSDRKAPPGTEASNSPATAAGLSTRAQRDSFAWDAMRVILEGTSPLELPAMAVADRAEAYEFLVHYGFDLNDADDRVEAWQIHDDALQFIHRYLLGDVTGTRRLEIPREVVQPEDLADLLVLASLGAPSDPPASQDARAPRRATALWACAVLRVMHTIHHANRAFHNENLNEIRKQVLDPFRQVLQVDELGCPVLLKGSHRVQLEGAFFKEDKSRDSIILKLLHKPNNVAQDIYDWIGIQFVTRTPADALLVVRFLRMHNLVTFANIVPGRSINNLVDLAAFRARYEESLVSRPDGDAEDALRAAIDAGELTRSDSAVHVNPFSGAEYRSIQFTCRQLIRIAHPARSILKALREHAGEELAGPLLARMEQISMQKEIAFFFPYEIQILDYENYLKTRMGESSHAAYKKRQLQAARRRVLQGLI